MQFNLVNVLVFLTVGCFFIGAVLFVGRLVRPTTPDREKNSTYECGERPIAQAWFNFNPRFYIVAIIFLIFDVEVAFTYPVATVFRRWAESGLGAFAFLELAVFLAILTVGLAYVWAKGDLEWLKQIKQLKTTAARPRVAAPAAPEPEPIQAAAARVVDEPAGATGGQV
ncbi:MAG TPA: NADH-quinone oxidoreductase subunit A [Polyangia bacterium]|jgi:NADH-quinone oxidoreductase subunit A